MGELKRNSEDTAFPVSSNWNALDGRNDSGRALFGKFQSSVACFGQLGLVPPGGVYESRQLLRLRQNVDDRRVVAGATSLASVVISPCCNKKTVNNPPCLARLVWLCPDADGVFLAPDLLCGAAGEVRGSPR